MTSKKQLSLNIHTYWQNKHQASRTLGHTHKHTPRRTPTPLGLLFQPEINRQTCRTRRLGSPRSRPALPGLWKVQRAPSWRHLLPPLAPRLGPWAPVSPRVLSSALHTSWQHRGSVGSDTAETNKRNMPWGPCSQSPKWQVVALKAVPCILALTHLSCAPENLSAEHPESLPLG